MIVLHAAIYEARLYVWGESPPEGQIVPRRRAAKKPKTASPEALPYDAGAKSLRGALAEAGMPLKTGKSEPPKMFLWLPTVNNRPVASSALIAEPPATQDRATLVPWMVTVLPLPPAESLDLLCLGAGRTLLAPGVVVGDDLRFLTRAMHFAAALVARQQVLPSIARVGKAYFARWGPIFAGADS